MRVLAGNVDRRAGSHVYHLELARRLASRGYRTSIVCTSALPEVRDFAEVHQLEGCPSHRSPIAWRLASWLRFRDLSRALRRMDLDPADVVVGGEHLFLKAHHRRFPRVPWIYLPHSLTVAIEIGGYGLPRTMEWVSLGLYRHLQRWALRHADRTLRFTRKSCEFLSEHYGRSIHPRYAVNPAGVDLPPDATRTPPGDVVRLLFVGRLVPGKGIEAALEALGGLKGSPWRLDIVGDGPSRAGLEQQARDLGLEGRVAFHGFCPDTSEWYRRADLLLFPSLAESLGLVVLEAMSHGVPCLAFRSDGKTYLNVLDEIIDHGRDGLLADGTADFARHLDSVIRSPGRSAGRKVPSGRAGRDESWACPPRARPVSGSIDPAQNGCTKPLIPPRRWVVGETAPAIAIPYLSHAC